MINISFSLNVDSLVHELTDTGKRQVPFAMALALNRTAEEMQVGIRREIPLHGITVRSAVSARFLANSIKITRADRASKSNLVARVRIEPPGKGGGRAGLLGFLEGGGVRFSQFAIGSGATFGPGSVVIPMRQTPGESVPRNLYPSQTGIQERRAIEGGKTKGALRGKRGTFVIRTGPQQGFVMQRMGKGRRDIHALFTIKPRINVPGRHFFFPPAERIARDRLMINFAGFMDHAMRTAR